MRMPNGSVHLLRVPSCHLLLTACLGLGATAPARAADDGRQAVLQVAAQVYGADLSKLDAHQQQEMGLIISGVAGKAGANPEAYVSMASPLARSAPPLPVRPDPGLSSRFGALWVISASPPQGGAWAFSVVSHFSAAAA